MKLQSLVESAKQLVTVTFKYHPTLTYTMLLKLVGQDGAKRPVYVGSCEVHDSKDEHTQTMHTCAVFRPNGTLTAASYWQTMQEAVKASESTASRMSYGRGHRNIYDNFETYREGEAFVDGYSQA